jgi:iron-sulfur cluster repair protein YtfE (RIC family)
MTRASGIAGRLHAAHQNTLTVLGDLQELIENHRHRPPELAQPQHRLLIDALLSMIDLDLLKHYRFEEQVLFPHLAAAGLSPVFDMLLLEHDSVRTIAAELREVTLAALAEGFSADSWTAFCRLIEDLAFSVTFHIQKEEAGVIRQLPLLLRLEEDTVLEEAYRGFA